MNDYERIQEAEKTGQIKLVWSTISHGYEIERGTASILLRDSLFVLALYSGRRILVDWDEAKDNQIGGRQGCNVTWRPA